MAKSLNTQRKFTGQTHVTVAKPELKRKPKGVRRNLDMLTALRLQYED